MKQVFQIMKRSTRRKFIQQSTFAAGLLLLSDFIFGAAEFKKADSMRFRLLRHATLLLDVNGKTILVDPMLSKKDSMDPVVNASSNARIPMVELPVSDDELKQLLNMIDAVLLTHTHRDHWDLAAQQMIDKRTPVLCQPADEEKIKNQGFVNVTAIADELLWNNILFSRTGGRHGTGEIGKLMGTVSGFVLSFGTQKLYIAGDTIWCSDVEDAIAKHHPSHIIANGGGAQFLTGDPITMTTDDVLKLSASTNATITVVHLDTINHCLQKRAAFREMSNHHHLSNRIRIPEDGVWVTV